MRQKKTCWGRRASSVHVRAFTLIEIILVIAVMLLAMTALVPLLSDRSDERVLKSAADALEKFARTARAEAAYRGASASVLIRPDGFQLYVVEAPLSGDGRAEAADGSLLEDAGLFEPAAEERAGEQPLVDSHLLPGGVVVKLRPWLATSWVEPEDYNWFFQPSGLCEPLAVRMEAGESWIELVFNPLTAQVQEESYAYP